MFLGTAAVIDLYRVVVDLVLQLELVVCLWDCFIMSCFILS